MKTKNVPDENAFYVTDGKVIRNLNELVTELDNISEETFKVHVNNEKNDFANWIDHVIGDKDLADAIKRVQSKTDLKKKLEGNVKNAKSDQKDSIKKEPAKAKTSAKPNAKKEPVKKESAKKPTISKSSASKKSSKKK